MISPLPALRSRGFTLFEVMLALALVSLVLMAVTIAIDVHLRLLDSGRMQVEEAQLARALLGRIADDLRSAVIYRPVEADEFLPTLSAATVEQATEDLDLATDEEVELPEEWATDTDELLLTPGLYGDRYQLQVDTSRLPRVDQYDTTQTTGSLTSVAELVSDVKTVTYYVLDDLQTGISYTTDASQSGSGLVRREQDRAATAYASQTLGLAETQKETEADLIAPEVAAIEFLYYDGTELVEEWDSSERGGLPVAVDIAIAIIPARSRRTAAASWRTATASTALEEQDLLVYRLLVHLPVAEPTSLEDTETSEPIETESEEELGQ